MCTARTKNNAKLWQVVFFLNTKTTGLFSWWQLHNNVVQFLFKLLTIRVKFITAEVAQILIRTWHKYTKTTIKKKHHNKWKPELYCSTGRVTCWLFKSRSSEESANQTTLAYSNCYYSWSYRWGHTVTHLWYETRGKTLCDIKDVSPLIQKTSQAFWMMYWSTSHPKTTWKRTFADEAQYHIGRYASDKKTSLRNTLTSSSNKLYMSSDFFFFF